MRTLLEYEQGRRKQMVLCHTKEELDAWLTLMVKEERLAGCELFTNFKAYSVGSELAAGSVMLGIKRTEMAKGGVS
jgi:hypothetical protein